MHECLRRWNIGLLIALRFVTVMNFNQVMFELSCKMVIDKINIACEDLIELRNIVVECRKILISHPSYVL